MNSINEVADEIIKQFYDQGFLAEDIKGALKLLLSEIQEEEF